MLSVFNTGVLRNVFGAHTRNVATNNGRRSGGKIDHEY
jgi:hypothetical protein